MVCGISPLHGPPLSTVYLSLHGEVFSMLPPLHQMASTWQLFLGTPLW